MLQVQTPVSSAVITLIFQIQLRFPCKFVSIENFSALLFTGNMAWLHRIFWFAVIFSCFVMASTAPATGKRRFHATADETQVSTILSALSGEEKGKKIRARESQQSLKYVYFGTVYII